MALAELKKSIEDKSAKLAVIGLGYVGLPLAAMCADVGFNVLGVEVKEERVERINAGKSPIEGQEPGLAELLARVINTGKLHATSDYTKLKDCDVVLIDVETPVNAQHEPEYVALRNALCSLGPALKQSALIIVESTIAPGTMKRVVQPELEKASGKKLNRGFYLGNCPERVMPGKLLANLRRMNRVVGGATPETAEVMAALYRHIVQAELDLTNCVTAELVKTVENAYRDVQIAFANEVALICEQVGGDVWKVRELVNKTPDRQMHLPGAGVGGHCIPKDPWLLASSLQKGDMSLRLIPAARTINDSMPLHMLELLKKGLQQAELKLEQAKVLVLGYAYLQNSDDTRNSPSAALVRELRSAGTKVCIHDPHVTAYQGDLYELAHGSDAVVLMTAHDTYGDIDLIRLRKVMKAPIIIDGRRVLDAGKVKKAGFILYQIGISD
ncbi:MAG TPA: nucleotide sugar dehydrogenase [Anaerolineae bacterium]|nr:nucleotide sugar dehydrogenase [Anaerolineae bacterium]